MTGATVRGNFVVALLQGTLGGIGIFGLNGFVIGPLIAALFIAFWDMFIREFNPE